MMLKLHAAEFLRLEKAMKQQTKLVLEDNRHWQEQIQALQQQIQELSAGQTALEERQAAWEEACQLKREETEKQQEQQLRAEKEALFASIFNNTIEGSGWLKDKSFSPGRWAVGYPYLYVCYRILNEIQPKHILELGLGQSTKLIGQYAASREDCRHTVVEHDADWISFWQKNGTVLSPQTNILQMELEDSKFRGKNVVIYQDFAEKLRGQKFHLISIDAPFGGVAGSVYARVDILDLIPECLEESFIILVDDANRIGELNMVKVLMKKLKEREIPFRKAVYSGMKDMYMIVSEDLKFLCTL